MGRCWDTAARRHRKDPGHVDFIETLAYHSQTHAQTRRAHARRAPLVYTPIVCTIPPTGARAGAAEPVPYGELASVRS